MKKTLLALTLAIFCLCLNAQKDQTIFSNSGLRLTGIWGGTTSNFNTSSNDFDYFSGGYFTFEISKKVLIGWSNYELNTIINDSRVTLGSNDFLVGYSPISYKPIHPFFYTSIGNGNIRIDGENEGKGISIQPAIALEVNVLRWLRLSVDGGYRIISGSQLEAVSDKDLSGPYFGLRAKFGWSWGR
ncbi:hypothetical protein [Portibacter marinus]|uniref:hypothetical protein n=1 Tax=Portibacter marinus TaxID=2898660 RepID=UPI001F1F9DD2|nr:hypothetical protein [Portibacter marinus]